MPKERAKRLAIAVLTTAVLVGCSYNSVRLVEPDQSFDGLEQFLNGDTASPNTRRLNVVFVHGMGHHPFGEPGISKYQQRIAQDLNFAPSDVQTVAWGALCPTKEERGDFQIQLMREGKAGLVTEKAQLDELREEKQAVCPLRSNNVIVGYVGWRQYRNQNEGVTRVLNLFELSWDRATEMLQKMILELDQNYGETIELDENLKPLVDGRSREADRAFINRWLKTFVNRQLGDPAVYLGTYGDSIRQTIADGLSKIASVEGTSKSNPYTIVSDSLGSRVVFDTLGRVLRPPDGHKADSPRSRPKLLSQEAAQVKALAQNIVQVFMNANQLPFLELSEATAPMTNESEEEWLRRMPCDATTRGMREFAKALAATGKKGEVVNVVAFTDPNDPLSYHLTRRFRQKCMSPMGEDGRTFKYINVRITNAEWNWGFALADPNQAHSDGFRKNDAAIHLLVHGYQRKGQER